jgi:transposase
MRSNAAQLPSDEIVYLGIDLHRKRWHVTIRTTGVELFSAGIPGTWEALEHLLGPYRGHPIEAVYEAGYFGYWLHDRLAEYGAGCVVTPPSLIPHEPANRVKTDRADAAALARFLRLGWLPEVTVPSEQTRALRQLLEARETLVSTRTKLKNMAHAAFARNGIALTRAAFASQVTRARLAKREDLPAHDLIILRACLRRIEALSLEITALEGEIITRGKALKGLRRLLQVHGLNLLSAISLLAEIGDITQFATSKQLVGYAGLAASTRQSNETTRHGKITKQGRKRLRTTVIPAVLAMVNRTETPLMEFYRKKKREKGAGTALCATARKLLTIIFVVLKKELDYWYMEDRLYNRKLRALNAAA